MAVLESFSLLLNKQVQTQKKLLEIEGQKTAILAKGDIDGLDALLKLEQPLVMHIAALERRHEALRLKLEHEGMGFRQLMDGPEKNQAGAVEAGLSELADTAGRLKRVVHINMGILNARQRAIAQILSFCGVQEQPFTYGRDGRLQAGGI